MQSRLKAMHRILVLGYAACAGALVMLAGCADDAVGPRASGVAPQALAVPSQMHFLKVSASNEYACAIKTDHTLVCWGSSDNWDDYGFPQPADLGTVEQIATGSYHTCAIKTDGSVVCWGPGHTTIPASVGTGVKGVAAGEEHTCAIRSDESIVCWGLVDGEPVEEFTVLQAQQILAAQTRTCLVFRVPTGADYVQCFGGVNDLDQTFRVIGFVTHVATGYRTTCAVKTDNTLACMGYSPAWHNALGQPPSEFLGPVKQSATGYDHTCAIKLDDTVTCWGGGNAFGQATPTAGLGTVKQIAAGYNYTCAIKMDDTMVCWGIGSGITNVPLGITHYSPTAAFTSPPRVQSGASFDLAFSGAEVVTPGGTISAADAGILYAYDCGDGLGYTSFTSAATVSCTAGAAGTQAVKGKVQDEDGDATEYSATVIVTEPEQAPSGLAYIIAGTTISLSWTDNSATETYFSVMRRERVLGTWAAWAELTQAAAEATSYDDTGEAGGQYGYMIRACNAVACSPSSNVVNVSLPAPAAPAGAAATVSGATSITVEWAHPGSTQTKFVLYRREYDGTSWGNYSEIGETAADALSYISTLLTADVKYQFQVRACSALVCSAASTTASVVLRETRPPTPDDVAAVFGAGPAVELTWDYSGPYLTGFEIQRRVRVAGVWDTYSNLGQVAVEDPWSYTDNDVLAGRKYQYRVRSCNESKCSAYVASVVVP